MGTPSDCTAPSTSHNRGPSTAYRCRRKIAFRRCLVVINRPIWPLCHKFCFGTHRSTVESRSGAQPSKVSSIGPGSRLDLPPEARKMRRFSGGKAQDGQNGAPRARERSPLAGQLLPARCVRALRLNSMPRLHSLRREASSKPRRTLSAPMVLAERFAGCHPSPWSLHNDSQACPHAPQGSGHASCYPEARVKPARP